MTSTKTFAKIILLALTIAVAMGTVTASQWGQGQAGPEATPLEGTWVVTVTLPPQVGPPFLDLTTFARGGVVLESSQVDQSAFNPVQGVPVVQGLGHGTWDKARDHIYIFTTAKFLYDPASGAVTGSFKGKGSLQLMGKDHFTGTMEATFCSPSVSDCVSVGCLPIEGRLMRLQSNVCE
jgi:hypothetical protein